METIEAVCLFLLKESEELQGLLQILASLEEFDAQLDLDGVFWSFGGRWIDRLLRQVVQTSQQVVCPLLQCVGGPGLIGEELANSTASVERKLKIWVLLSFDALSPTILDVAICTNDKTTTGRHNKICYLALLEFGRASKVEI